MQNLSKSVMRVAKNSVKGYSDVQTKVRDATSNDPWGPSGTQMSEIAALTFNQNDFVEIMEMLDKRLNDKGKNWRHVFKSLTLLDYCLHAGSENTVMYFRENLYIIKTLKEFQYIDDYGKDQGANVRQKAKDITNLLLDENRMQSQRKSRASMTDRMNGGGRPRSNTQGDDDDNRNRDTNRRARSVPPGGSGDADLAAAIEASKRSAAEESNRGSRPSGDDELEEAMRLSREEDEKRKRELASQSGAGLFDEQRQQQSNNLIDIDAPYQHPAQTGMNFSSYNPYAAQQQQLQQQQQEEWMRQQQMMELQRQAEEQAQYQNMLQQQAFAQQQQQAQEEYMRQQAYQQQMAQQYQPQPLIPQATAYGSNNPFAAFAPTPATPPPALPQSNSFNDNYAPQSSAAPIQQQQPRPPRDDGKHSDLARLLGEGSGMDTFGNVGNARLPGASQFGQQRTGNPLSAQQTGMRPNPFQNNFTQPQQQQQQQPQQPPNNPFFDL